MNAPNFDQGVERQAAVLYQFFSRSLSTRLTFGTPTPTFSDPPIKGPAKVVALI
jgi:hypothetical protein